MKKRITLSLIIPAYNEENHLEACLESVKHQTEKPEEVFVVDNNSTDKTVEIAKKYDFVTLLHEKRQGLIPARNNGFDAATCQLLGRIDADTILEPDWVEQVKEGFRTHRIDGMTGFARIYVHLFDWFIPLSTFWTRVYFLQALATYRFQVLWGPNMVIRNSVWKQIKDQLAQNDHEVHEDQDISITMKANGYITYLNKNMIIDTDGMRFTFIDKAIEYTQRQNKTIRRHKANGNLERINENADISWLKSKFVLLFTLPFGLLYAIVLAIAHIARKLKIIY